jgi:predicted flap endonuclease-1-like 5' DNA nuclease
MVEPRQPDPVSALGRPVHDQSETVAPAVPPEPAVPAGAALPTAPAPGPAAIVDSTVDSANDQEQNDQEQQEQEDDLRRIRGVGPAIESALHGLGIRSYRQLVTLDDAGLDRVRDALRDFRQRIEREDWIGQARRLHREKYGEEV